MQLFGSLTSPYVRHCRIALMQAGIEHELVATDYASSARLSPTQRVPFLLDGDLRLSDSASILRHIRQRQGQPFLPRIEDFDFFLLASTALDTTVNLFLMDRDGIGPAQSAYLQRQADRIQTSLNELADLSRQHPERSRPIQSDALLRLGCFLGWALFRERLDLQHHPALLDLLAALDSEPLFAATRPVA